MRSPWSHFAGVVLVVTMSVGAVPARAQMWRKFMPTGEDAERSAPKAREGRGLLENSTTSAESQDEPADGRAGGEFALKQENGPWLIVAASFSGEGAEKQAHDLAQELREQFRIAAYVHEMNFKFGDEMPGRGLDEYGAPTRRHFRRGNQVHELAVLVGDFSSIDDPEAQRMLDRIKSLEPEALEKLDADKTAQSMAQVRRFEDALMEKLGKSRKRGPMAQAFFSRNPLLPREYFVPKGVDAFVAKMNEGVEHSLLDCPGRQTIQVATFRGKTILQTNAQDDQSAKSFWSRRKNEDHDPLVEAAENAHLLTKELRAHGWEAYEFHDRTESIVTIGSFAEATQRLSDGRIVATPEVQKVITTFDASFDTPADPLSGIGNDETTRRLVEQQEQQISLNLSSQQAQIVQGLNPKHVKILRGHGKNVKVERIIPMDVHPQAIDVPKQNVSSAYAG